MILPILLFALRSPFTYRTILKTDSNKTGFENPSKKSVVLGAQYADIAELDRIAVP